MTLNVASDNAKHYVTRSWHSNVNKCHELTFELAVMLLVKQYYVKAIKLNMNQNQQ